MPSPTRRSPLRLSLVADTRSEAERQTEGVRWLRSQGYAVDLVGQGRRPFPCAKCRQMVFPTGEVGNTAGVADTHVNHPKRWQSPLIELPVEWKKCPDPGTEKGRRTKWFSDRPEQEARYNAGRIVVVWDLPSLAVALARFEIDVLGIEPLPLVAALVADHEERQRRAATA